MPIKMRRGGSWRSSSASRRKRRVTLAPPMCLHLRHSFEGIILGFASGRKRLWRSTIRLKAITDRPEVSALSLWVRLEPERERRSLIGHDCNMGRGSSAQSSTATGTVTSLRPRSSSASPLADRIQKLRVAATTTTAKANSAATLARMRVVRHSRSIFGTRSGVFTGVSLVIAGVEILARERFLRGNLP